MHESLTAGGHELNTGQHIHTRMQMPFSLPGADNEEGTCYVETMNLDGETNLKVKKAMEETKAMGEAQLALLAGSIECDPPNSRCLHCNETQLVPQTLVSFDR